MRIVKEETVKDMKTEDGKRERETYSLNKRGRGLFAAIKLVMVRA